MVKELEFEWIAVYDDGSIFRQYDEDGTEHRYADIDRDRLAEFHLRVRGQDKTVVAYAFDPGMRLIYRRRVAMSGVTGEKIWTIHMVGWQQTVRGKNVQSISWVFPDGSIINTGRFRKDHPIFYGVELLPFEEDSEPKNSQDD